MSQLYGVPRSTKQGHTQRPVAFGIKRLRGFSTGHSSRAGVFGAVLCCLYYDLHVRRNILNWAVFAKIVLLPRKGLFYRNRQM